MKCPHCLENFHDHWSNVNLPADKEGHWRVQHTACPACERMTARLLLFSQAGNRVIQVHPKGVARTPLPNEVPQKYATDYREACNVLADSAKASAALSRRCLQLLLREVAGVKASDLSKEIDAVLPSLPSSIAEAVDAVRVIGNFAAHPLKSTNTGEIVDVEPGEAEWSLDVLESVPVALVSEFAPSLVVLTGRPKIC